MNVEQVLVVTIFQLPVECPSSVTDILVKCP